MNYIPNKIYVHMYQPIKNIYSIIRYFSAVETFKILKHYIRIVIKKNKGSLISTYKRLLAIITILLYKI